MTRITIALAALLTLSACYTTAQGLGAGGGVDAQMGFPVAGPGGYGARANIEHCRVLDSGRIRCR